MASTDIVVVNVFQRVAPAPNTLQQTGALVTQGGSSTAPGTQTLVSTTAQLAALLSDSVAISTLAWSGGVVTVTTAAPHGWTIGDQVGLTVAGALPLAYSGTFVGTVTGALTLTYPLTTNPGASTAPGRIALGASAELASMGNTYFSQPSGPAIYVLELGEGDPAEGPPELDTWIQNNPRTVYSYAVPREWDNIGPFLSLAGKYSSLTSLTYFFVTTLLANRAVYAGIKSVYAVVESPLLAAGEFSAAAMQAVTLAYQPTSTTKVAPLSYSYLYNVTPYPVPGNGTVFLQLAAANVNWVGTGAEGGISTSIIFQGQLSDGNPFNYWYGTDWAQINGNLVLSNEIINGSNTGVNPLDYDQHGIDRLQNRAAQLMRSAVTNGLFTGTVKLTKLSTDDFTANYNAGIYADMLVVNCEPFLIHVTENPTNYAQGIYSGMSVTGAPARGFKQVIFNLTVTNIIA
jgi:hypothetical protein